MSEKLSELVKNGESEEVEFKKSTAQLDRALGRLPEIKGNSRVVAVVFSPELEENSFKEKVMKGLWHDYGTIQQEPNFIHRICNKK